MKYFPDPRLNLLIELSLDQEISVPSGGWRMLVDDEDIPAISEEMDSSLLSQICLQQLGTWGCGFSEFCWSIVCLPNF